MSFSSEDSHLSPWHERLPNFEEERRYLNFIDLHKMTEAWLQEISPTMVGNTHRLERVVPSELAQNLWLLEKVKLDQLAPELSKMIDAQSVSRFLSELEETILIVQSTTLENALQTTKDRISLLNLLEKVSWKHGKALAEKRWPDFTSQITDLETLSPIKYFQALMDFPLWNNDEPAFLLERTTPTLCSFYWLRSPQNVASLKLSPNMMELAQLYHEMIRGFFYGLSRSLKVEILPALLNDQKVYHITLHL
jgi:hypothetical protein